MLEPTQDNEQIIERIAALDIGKAELVCCVRVPDPKGSGTTRSILSGCARSPSGRCCGLVSCPRRRSGYCGT